MQTSGISNPLSDPLLVFILQLLISGVVTIIVSIVVARRWGEMAATKYTMTKTDRSSHHHTLVGEPLNMLKEALSSSKVYQILIVSALFSLEPVAQIIALNEKRLPEVDLLLSHLKEGYPELHNRILRFKKSYDGITDSALQVYHESVGELRERWEKRPLDKSWKMEGGYASIAEAISVVVNRRLVNGQGIVGAQLQASNSVTIGGRQIVEIPSPPDPVKIVADVNALLDDGQMQGKLQRLWERAKPLLGDCQYFNEELERIRAGVQAAGVSLKGWCSAGREAGYE